MKKSKRTDSGNKAPDGVGSVKGGVRSATEDRGTMLSLVWGKRRVARLNEVIDADYCGCLTVREFVAIVLADKLNFPRGLDTHLCIGDFEGNFCTNTLGVTVGGSMSDHVCVMGDPHGYME